MNVDIEPSDQYSENFIVASYLKLMLPKFQEFNLKTFKEGRASGQGLGSEPKNTKSVSGTHSEHHKTFLTQEFVLLQPRH